MNKTRDKIDELIRTLAHETAAGCVAWEYYPDDHIIWAKAGPGVVRIAERDPSDGVDSELVMFEVSITAPGRVKEQVEVSEGDPSFATLRTLFPLARKNARNTVEVFDEMIRALQTKG